MFLNLVDKLLMESSKRWLYRTFKKNI